MLRGTPSNHMMTGIAVLLGDGCRLPARSGVSPLIPRGVYLFRAKEQAVPTTLAALPAEGAGYSRCELRSGAA